MVRILLKLRLQYIKAENKLTIKLCYLVKKINKWNGNKLAHGGDTERVGHIRRKVWDTLVDKTTNQGHLQENWKEEGEGYNIPP